MSSALRTTQATLDTPAQRTLLSGSIVAGTLHDMNPPIIGFGSRLSCADSAFPRLSHDAALGVIRDLGIPAVDICVFAGYDHNPPPAVFANPSRAGDAVLRRLERLELEVADVFVIPGASFEELAVNHPDVEVRRESMSRFRRAVEFAHRLGS